ncbi:hypothetical protein ANO11243_059480 [Dothideomycetidae sp. 11243]|nr:hypothetical protein ANO11243_059480 [fungal sp. No.11243]
MTTSSDHSAIGGKGPLVLIITWALTAISVIAVGLRGYAASHTNGKWRWDFIWAVICAVFGLMGAICLTVAVQYGLGNHIKTLISLDVNDIWATIHWLWISIFLGLAATTFAKYSMIALMLQVQGPTAHKRRIALYALGALFTIVNIIQIVLSYTQCRPISRLWDRELPGNCDGGAIASDWSILQGSIGAFADFVLALWPVGIAWNLQTTLKIKVMFCLLMGVGMLPAIVSVFRVTHIPAPSISKDITLDFADFMILCVVEFWAIVILTSIPVLRPLFLRIFYGIKSSTHSKSGPQSKFSAAHGGVSNHVTRNKSTGASRIMDTEKYGSEENVLGHDHMAMNIMVSKAYAVEEDRKPLPRRPAPAFLSPTL